jgi:hypothetical protein
MSLVDKLKEAGFKPEKSTEGEFQPFEGVYATTFVQADVKPANDKGGRCLVVGFKISETLAGKESHSKFNEFKKYLALEGDEATSKNKGIPWIINALFTAGVEVPWSTEEELIVSIQGALGTTVYLRAYGFKPEDSDKSYQMFVVMKEDNANKKAQEIKNKQGHPL